MSVKFTPEVKEFLGQPLPLILSVARDDGSILMATVWFEFRAGHFLLNSQRGRTWPALVEKRGRLSMMVLDPSSIYRYIEVEGRVVEVTEKGAYAHINKLSRMYSGQDFRVPDNPARPRVRFKVEPVRLKVYP